MMAANEGPVRARHFFLWIAIAAAAWFAAQRWDTSAPPADRAPAQPGTPINGRAKIIDGDSLEVAGERIRLFGIDAPEGRQQCRDAKGEDYACGREAARILTALIGGRPVSCTLVTHDQYARDVATCQAKGHDLGEAMVRAGYARDYARHSKGRYAAAERDARAAKRGIWAGASEDPAAWRKREMR
jgi:endonuclease YncB( thermonuclease family)